MVFIVLLLFVSAPSLIVVPGLGVAVHHASVALCPARLLECFGASLFLLSGELLAKTTFGLRLASSCLHFVVSSLVVCIQTKLMTHLRRPCSCGARGLDAIRGITFCPKSDSTCRPAHSWRRLRRRRSCGVCPFCAGCSCCCGAVSGCGRRAKRPACGRVVNAGLPTKVTHRGPRHARLQ